MYLLCAVVAIGLQCRGKLGTCTMNSSLTTAVNCVLCIVFTVLFAEIWLIVLATLYSAIWHSSTFISAG